MIHVTLKENYIFILIKLGFNGNQLESNVYVLNKKKNAVSVK